MTEDNKEKLRAVFEHLGLIKHIPPHIFDELSEKFSRVTFEKGDSVLKQGRSGGAFFLLTGGKISVWVESGGAQIKVNTMEPYAFFGEIALLDSSERTATLIAEEEVVVYSLGKKDFMQYLYSIDEVRKQVGAAATTRKKHLAESTPPAVSAAPAKAPVHVSPPPPVVPAAPAKAPVVASTPPTVEEPEEAPAQDSTPPVEERDDDYVLDLTPPEEESDENQE